MISSTKQAEAKPVSHTSWIFPNTHIDCAWLGLHSDSGDSGLRATSNMLHKYTHEAGCLKYKVLFDKKGLLRASGLPSYWICHTQAQTGRGVCLHTLHFSWLVRLVSFTRYTAPEINNHCHDETFLSTEEKVIWETYNMDFTLVKTMLLVLKMQNWADDYCTNWWINTWDMLVRRSRQQIGGCNYNSCSQQSFPERQQYSAIAKKSSLSACSRKPLSPHTAASLANTDNNLKLWQKLLAIKQQNHHHMAGVVHVFHPVYARQGAIPISLWGTLTQTQLWYLLLCPLTAKIGSLISHRATRPKPEMESHDTEECVRMCVCLQCVSPL